MDKHKTDKADAALTKTLWNWWAAVKFAMAILAHNKSKDQKWCYSMLHIYATHILKKYATQIYATHILKKYMCIYKKVKNLRKKKKLNCIVRPG